MLEPALANEPEQSPVTKAPFAVEQGGVSYRVEPLYRYRLYGLVVSRRTHDGDRMLHGRWNDHLNVADLCVVWGANAAADLSHFDFWNGQFTCFFNTGDAASWARFRPDQLGNNHLLADTADLRARIAAVRVGDQVEIAGYLASYGNDHGFRRGTSTTRTDTGNGACETIYVTALDVLRPSPAIWPRLQSLSAIGLGASFILWLLAALRGWI